MPVELVEAAHRSKLAPSSATVNGGFRIPRRCLEEELMSVQREGGCTCGAVRYGLASDPLFVHCCHRLEYGPEVRFVRGGTLDEPSGVAPDVHIFTKSKLGWIELPDSVPAFEVY
jgi:hypothetical protein